MVSRVGKSVNKSSVKLRFFQFNHFLYFSDMKKNKKCAHITCSKILTTLPRATGGNKDTGFDKMSPCLWLLSHFNSPGLYSPWRIACINEASRNLIFNSINSESFIML